MTTPTITPNAVDLTGLEQLRRSAARDDKTAVAEVAVQFEALFIGMMLDSARKANLGDGLFDGQQTQQYLELMDQQVALDMARHGGLGFGKMLLQQLTPGAQVRPSAVHAPLPGTGAAPSTAPSAETQASSEAPSASQATAEFPAALPQSMAALGGAAEEAYDVAGGRFRRAALAPRDGCRGRARRRATLAARASCARDRLGRRRAASTPVARRPTICSASRPAARGAARGLRNGLSSTRAASP